MAVLTTYSRVADPFKQGTHTGLDFAYGIGVVRNDNVVNKVVAGTVTLVDNSTNYIEVDSDGIVSANQLGYTSGQIPLFTVTTVSGTVTEVVDDRSFFSVATDGGGAYTTGWVVEDISNDFFELTTIDVPL